MRKAILAFLGAAVLAGAGAMAADEMRPGEAIRTEVGKAVGSEVSDAISSNPDRAFAAALISHARLQRQLTDLVAEKATNPQIKQYAKELAEEYEKASDRVKQAAEKEGITLQQDRMLPRDQAVLEFMKQLPASTLERNFVFHEAGATQSQMLMAEWASKNAQKPGIKQAAQDIASKLQTRNSTAQKLAQSEINGGGVRAVEDR